MYYIYTVDSDAAICGTLLEPATVEVQATFRSTAVSSECSATAEMPRFRRLRIWVEQAEQVDQAQQLASKVMAL